MIFSIYPVEYISAKADADDTAVMTATVFTVATVNTVYGVL